MPTYTFTFDEDGAEDAPNYSGPKFDQYLDEWRGEKRLAMAERYVLNAADDWILAYSKLAGELENKSIARTAIVKERSETPTETPDFVGALNEFINTKFILEHLGEAQSLSSAEISDILDVTWQKFEDLIPPSERSEQMDEVIGWI